MPRGLARRASTLQVLFTGGLAARRSEGPHALGGRGCLTTARQGGKRQTLYGGRAPALLTHRKPTLKTGWAPALGSRRAPAASCPGESLPAERSPLWKAAVPAAAGTGHSSRGAEYRVANSAVLLRRRPPPAAGSPCTLPCKGTAQAGDPGARCPCWGLGVEAGAGALHRPRGQRPGGPAVGPSAWAESLGECARRRQPRERGRAPPRPQVEGDLGLHTRDVGILPRLIHFLSVDF